jgi:hypothetical protein
VAFLNQNVVVAGDVVVEHAGQQGGVEERKKERKKWRTSLSPKAMGPRAAAGGKCAVQGAGEPVRNAGNAGVEEQL